MSFLRRRRIRKQADKDGAIEKDQGHDRILAELGRRPESDIELYADQGLRADDLHLEAELREHTQPYLNEHPSLARPNIPAPLLTIGAGVFIGAGTLATISLLRNALGLAPADRILIGLGIECLVLALTSAVHEAINESKITASSVAACILYVALLSSIAALRLSEVTAPGEELVFLDWAAAILLVFGTAGPSWLAEISLRLLFEQHSARRLAKLTSRRIRSETKRLGQAKQGLHTLGEAQRGWDDEYAHLMAIYRVTFNEKLASLNPGGDATTVPFPEPSHIQMRN